MAGLYLRCGVLAMRVTRQELARRYEVWRDLEQWSKTKRCGQSFDLDSPVGFAYERAEEAFLALNTHDNHEARYQAEEMALRRRVRKKSAGGVIITMHRVEQTIRGAKKLLS